MRRCIAEGLVPDDRAEGGRFDLIVTEGRRDRWAVRAVVRHRGGGFVVAVDDGGRWHSDDAGAEPRLVLPGE